MNLTGTYTRSGLTLAAKVMAGTPLSVTKVVAGSGSTDLSAVALQDGRQTLLLSAPARSGTTVTFPATLVCAEAEAAFSLTELGLYAQDPEKGEILYQLYQVDPAVSIQPDEQTVYRFYLSDTVNTQTQVTANLVLGRDEAAVDAALAEFSAQVELFTAHASRHAAGGADPITPAAINAVNKAGDTMTGNLTVARSAPTFAMQDTSTGAMMWLNSVENSATLQTINVAGDLTNRRKLILRNSAKASDMANALIVTDMVSGTEKRHTVLHTGNKPSGSYTGNGSAAERTIDTGGIGNVVFVNSSNGSALIGDSGAICFSGETVTGLKSNQAKFVGGVLTLQTDSTYANSSAVTYYYQVL